ncbi:hypothetical protein T03_16390 [Trichinella britovi]|uniref:Uncharacterized protein n=1 Tax=Trichinella britovi TaxID=45882 RepID=A0A0V1C429_TRIBR|nr:hypothetical protein T03_16390 [Trichinella britovi]
MPEGAEIAESARLKGSLLPNDSAFIKEPTRPFYKGSILLVKLKA